MKKTLPKTIDEYIAGFPANVQEILKQVRKTVKEAAPQAEETIKYGMPTFTLNGNLVYFAAFKNHIGFYPLPKNKELAEEFSRYQTGKGSIQFPLERPLPLDLIAKIVAIRIEENGL